MRMNVAGAIMEWIPKKTGDLVWKFPKNIIAWNSRLIVHEKQAAAIFTDVGLFEKPEIHDVFSTGEYVLTPVTCPLAAAAPGINDGITLAATVLFCYIGEYDHSSKVWGGYGEGGAYISIKGDAKCKFAIVDGGLFLRNVVGPRKRFTADKILKFVNESLGEELLRRHGS